LKGTVMPVARLLGSLQMPDDSMKNENKQTI